jgi:16S rRNA (cytosine967-C5)-methyltransferase
MAVSLARTVAFDVLLRVAAGAYASDLLAAKSAELDARDAGLASEIVFGALRYQAQLDHLIETFAGPRRLDAEVRVALRMGVYQLRYLERIPAHAAVGEAVELVKRARKGSAAAFVNAVLRKVGQIQLPGQWPSREIALSCPEWLLERWERHYGAEAAEGIARATLRPPEKYFRGERMQDIGSQSIVPLLRLERGQSFLDVCAAPGNKTAQALEAGVRAVACDVHWHRLAQMKGPGGHTVSAEGRAGHPAAHGQVARHLQGGTLDLVVADATRPLPFARMFERILVDAPCSGTGTLARNPEIKWKLRPEDLPLLHGRQVAILRNALALLAPGGILVYSTCSLEAEENEGVVNEAVSGLGPRGPGHTFQRLPGRDAGDGFYAAVLESRVPAND